jgi:hypothetical protein
MNPAARTGDAGPVRFTNCGHFFAAAAEAMRRILIDSARGKEAQKRGAGLQHVNLDDVDVDRRTPRPPPCPGNIYPESTRPKSQLLNVLSFTARRC